MGVPTMTYSQRMADPRWQEAISLFDASVRPQLARLPNGHAIPNIQHALCCEVLEPEESGYFERQDGLIRRTVALYVAEPGRERISSELLHIRNSIRGRH